MSAKRKKFSEGQWLKSEIAKSGLSQSDFAKLAGVSRQSLTLWFGKSKLAIRPDKKAKLAKALGTTLEGFQHAIESAHVEWMRNDPETQAKWKRQVEAVRRAGNDFNAMISDRNVPIGEADDFPEKFPPGLDVATISQSEFVPFYRDAPADPTLEGEAAEDGVMPVHPSDRNMIVVRITGDCMAPKFKHGESVLFSEDAYYRDGIIDGKSYLVVLQDGRSTFKRVFNDRFNPNEIILRCYNRKKYPEEFRVNREDVYKMLRASKRVFAVND